MIKSFIVKFFSEWNFSTKLLLIVIFLLTLFLRLYRFDHRWGLGSDDTRDIIIAQEAIKRGELPLFGSFSSAGPFVFGPLFYWFLMFGYLLLPYTVNSPWILLVLVSIATVFILMICGYLLGGQRFALIVGFLAATSSQFVYRSFSLGQHSLVSVFSALLILFLILLFRFKKGGFAFLVGLSLGIAINMHYQAINLMLCIPIVFLLPKMKLRQKMKLFIFMFIGFFLPFIPLISWDKHQDYANFRNLADYLLIGQYRLYVANSWRLFILKYLPTYWSFVVGGYWIVGLFLELLTGVIIFVQFLKKKLTGSIIILFSLFFSLLLLNRYYKGERSEGYLIYLSSFIIIFSAFMLDCLFEYSSKVKQFTLKKGIFFSACFLFISIIYGNVKNSWNLISKYENHTVISIYAVEDLISRFPNTSFSLYDYEWQSSGYSYPLSLFLKQKRKVSRKGHPIGLICLPSLNDLPLIFYHRKCRLVDLQNTIINEVVWRNVNPETIYDDLITRWKENKLSSTFHL